MSKDEELDGEKGIKKGRLSKLERKKQAAIKAEIKAEGKYGREIPLRNGQYIKGFIPTSTASTVTIEFPGGRREEYPRSKLLNGDSHLYSLGHDADRKKLDSIHGRKTKAPMPGPQPWPENKMVGGSRTVDGVEAIEDWLISSLESAPSIEAVKAAVKKLYEEKRPYSPHEFILTERKDYIDYSAIVLKKIEEVEKDHSKIGEVPEDYGIRKAVMRLLGITPNHAPASGGTVPNPNTAGPTPGPSGPDGPGSPTGAEGTPVTSPESSTDTADGGETTESTASGTEPGSVPGASDESASEPATETDGAAQKSEQEKQVELDYESKLRGSLTINEIKSAVEEFGNVPDKAKFSDNFYALRARGINRIIDQFAELRDDVLLDLIPEAHGLKEAVLRVLEIPYGLTLATPEIESPEPAEGSPELPDKEESDEELREAAKDYELDLVSAENIEDIKDAIRAFGHANKISSAAHGYGNPGYIDDLFKKINLVEIQERNLSRLGGRNDFIIEMVPEEHGLRKSVRSVLGIPEA